MEQQSTLARPRFSVTLGVLVILLVAMYSLIFTMSAQDGATSGGLSETLTALIVPETSASFATWHMIVRKGAHVMEFAVLYLLWYLAAMEAYPELPAERQAFLPAALTLVSAALDELHQTFVPGRTPLVTDVVIDMAGVLLLTMLLYRMDCRRTGPAGPPRAGKTE